MRTTVSSAANGIFLGCLHAPLALVAIVGLCPLVGCQGANTPLAPTSRTVSFANDIQPIFNNRCVVCHRVGGVADLAGIRLKLVEDVSYDLLVQQPSIQRPELTIVVPGDAQSSLVFLKVSSDSPPVGARMPLGGLPVPANELGLIRDWINQGALNN